MNSLETIEYQILQGKKYEKLGYLDHDYKIFHLLDKEKKDFSFHYHDFNKIVIFISGNVNYSIEGKNYKLEPYDIVFVNAGEIHRPSILDDNNYERIIIYVSTQFLDSFSNQKDKLKYCFEQAKKEHTNLLRIPSVKKSKLYQVCEELVESISDDSFANELYQKILFLEFMIQINRAVITNHIHFIDHGSNHSKILPILEYINEHLKEDITIDSLSTVFYMSRYYLMHLFKKEMGYTIGNYITEKRLQFAKQMITNGCSLTEACFQSGFKNYSSFLRAFKKVYHKLPKNSL